MVDLGLAHLLVIGRGASGANNSSCRDISSRSERTSTARRVTHGENAVATYYNTSTDTGRLDNQEHQQQQPPLTFSTASARTSASSAAAAAAATKVCQYRRDWAAILSIGEQQRICIARVLYHRPALAFLDEGTSAVTEATEKNIYGFLREAGVTVVAVGHRTSLRALHERILSLEGAPDGRWNISGV